jgi:hypothetical protein
MARVNVAMMLTDADEIVKRQQNYQTRGNLGIHTNHRNEAFEFGLKYNRSQVLA